MRTGCGVERTFRDAFADHNSAGDMDAYVRDAFSLDRIRIEMTDEANTFLRASMEGREQPNGYAKLLTGAADPHVTGPELVELRRLYVGRELGLDASAGPSAFVGQALLFLLYVAGGCVVLLYLVFGAHRFRFFETPFSDLEIDGMYDFLRAHHGITS